MKRIIYTLTTLLLTASLQAFALGIEIQPTMYSRTNAQDRVWVGTFQLVWNDFMDRIVHNPIRFREGTPVMVHQLNRQSFTIDDVSEKSYYKYAGKVTKNTRKQISKAIKKKFKTTSDLLDKLDLIPRNDMYIIYAMLKKDFEFIREFDKLGDSLFGKDSVAEYFGIDKDSDNSLGNGVRVLFYNSPQDFAVKLLTLDNDEVFLYKNSSNKPFNFIYDDMKKKQNSFKGETDFTNVDELRIPNLSIYEEVSFDEICGRRIMGTNMVINQAMETIQFNMNNKGVALKSEAAVTLMTTSLLPEHEPRFFNFDNTFVIFLKEKGKKRPYFAMRVNDITKFQGQTK